MSTFVCCWQIWCEYAACQRFCSRTIIYLAFFLQYVVHFRKQFKTHEKKRSHICICAFCFLFGPGPALCHWDSWCKWFFFLPTSCKLDYFLWVISRRRMERYGKSRHLNKMDCVISLLNKSCNSTVFHVFYIKPSLWK